MIDVERKAYKLAIALGLLPGCFEPNIYDVIKVWLEKNYDTQRHGPPSYQRLAEAVADKVGPANPALAKKIATNHPGGLIKHLEYKKYEYVLTHV